MNLAARISATYAAYFAVTWCVGFIFGYFGLREPVMEAFVAGIPAALFTWIMVGKILERLNPEKDESFGNYLVGRFATGVGIGLALNEFGVPPWIVMCGCAVVMGICIWLDRTSQNGTQLVAPPR